MTVVVENVHARGLKQECVAKILSSFYNDFLCITGCHELMKIPYRKNLFLFPSMYSYRWSLHTKCLTKVINEIVRIFCCFCFKKSHIWEWLLWLYSTSGGIHAKRPCNPPFDTKTTLLITQIINLGDFEDYCCQLCVPIIEFYVKD